MQSPIAKALLGLLVAAALASCGPEDGRARGGGPGADVGNKAPTVVPASKVYTVPAEDSPEP